MTDFDCIVIGAGVSGLTLADALSSEPAAAERVLVVDKDDDPDYNISFWLKGEPPFAPVMQNRSASSRRCA